MALSTRDAYFSHILNSSVSCTVKDRNEIINNFYSSFKLQRKKTFSTPDSFISSMQIDTKTSRRLLVGSNKCQISLFELFPDNEGSKLISSKHLYTETSTNKCTSLEWFYDNELFFTGDSRGHLVVWNSVTFQVLFYFFICSLNLNLLPFHLTV